jgi:hypothetical protein
MGSLRGSRDGVTRGELAGQIVERVPGSCALSELCEDAQGEWVAADTGQVLAQKVGGSGEVAGDRGADHFEVMAFPVHLPSAGAMRRCFGEGAEIGGGKLEAGVGLDRVAERRYGVRGVDGALRLAIEGGGLGVGGDCPTVVLARKDGSARGVGRFLWFLKHGYQLGLLA